MNTVVIFGALSPYHIARIREAGVLWSAGGASLTLIERVGRQDDYPLFGGLDCSQVRIERAYDAHDPCPPDSRSASQLVALL
jgi:hypothetical protein